MVRVKKEEEDNVKKEEEEKRRNKQKRTRVSWNIQIPTISMTSPTKKKGLVLTTFLTFL